MKDCAAHNRIYRVVWNRARGVWMVVGELARGLGKGSGRKKHSLRGLLLLIPLALFSTAAMAAPTGGQVTAGTGTISQSGATTTINQSSQNLSLSWKTFNVGSSETVNFNQPNASALAINRIADTNGSRIMGHLNANGQVWLINPNGILFGSSAQVNVGGLVASTLDTADGSTFAGNGKGSIVNEGTITASQYVALLGHSVTNSGVITARLGTVAMGAGDNVSLTFSGNSLVKLQVNQSVIDALVANHGLIKADGGMVIMNAGARDTLLASVVNNDGIVQAQTVSNHNGSITLLGGMAAGTVDVGGTLDASAPNGGNGGFIETSGAHVQIASGAVIDAGQGGQWLIDPVDLTIDTTAAGTINTTLAAGTSVTEQTSATTASGSGTQASGLGDINVDAPISWSTAATLTLSAYHSLNINALITNSGTGTLSLVTNNNVGGTSSGGAFNVNAPINLAGTSTFKLNNTPYTIITSLGAAGSTTGTDLQGIAGGLAGHYVLGANIDASGTSTWNTNQGFAPISTFTGVFDGLGHSISGLTINRPAGKYVGLFGSVGTGGIVRNIGLVGGSVTGYSYVGGLAGSNGGTISSSYATGSVSGSSVSGAPLPIDFGGLVGINYGTISSSYATGSVSGNAGGNAGGLVGSNHFGTISGSYATGSVSGDAEIGGLVGSNNSGTISNSYATGNATGSSTYVGGLAGYNSSISTISNSYATGSVSGSGLVGGLVGSNSSGTISNSYWDITTTGMGTNAGYGANTGTVTGGGGLTTAQLAAALPSGFSSSVWANAGNQTTPYLLANASLGTVSGHVILGSDTSATPAYYDVIQTLTELQDINGTGLAGSYVLGTNIDASATSGWNGGAGFAPIGTFANKFTGVFDGLGHTISNLTINRTASDYLGLFGSVGTGGIVRNVGLTGGSVTGSSNVGGLAGSNGGTITGAYATGSVSGGTGTSVGGLVGVNTNSGTISNSYATVSVSGGVYVGGLVGSNSGAISNAYATGDISGASGSSYVGGLVGNNLGPISNSYATGNVSGTSYVGGLVGSNTNATISNSYATGNVSGTSYVGGLGGANSGTISNGYWDTATTGKGTNAGYGANTGTVTGGGGLTSAQLAAALPMGFRSSVWANAGNQTTPYLLANASFGTVSGHVILGSDTSVTPTYYDVIQTLTELQDINSTGLAGHYVLGTNLDASATSGWNGGAGFAPIGSNYSTHPFSGVFDGLDHTITNLHINRSSTNYVGLFGVIRGTVRNIGLVGGSVTGGTYVGELAGTDFRGAISNAYATGSVSGAVGGSYAGGLVGSNNGGTISGAYATGGVIGGNNVGGMAGSNTGTISSAYATGSVTGGSNVGGLVGQNFGTISDSYATGRVSGTGLAGGLVGSNLGGTISHGYWDTTTTGKGTNAGYGNNAGTVTGGGGLTDTQMQQQANFTGFDFANTWVQYDGHTDPLLRVFMTPLTVTATGGSKTYDGVAGNGVSYSSTPDSRLLGTLSYGISANAGSYTTSLGGLYSDQQGYAIGYANSALTVNKAALTVTANGAAKAYDGTAYSGGNGVSYSGFVHGETASVLGGGLSYGGSSQGAVNAGRYAITPFGLMSGNYTLSFVDGVLTIEPATAPEDVINVRVTNQSLLSGGSPTPLGHLPTPPVGQGGSSAHKPVVPSGGSGHASTHPDALHLHVNGEGVNLPPDSIY